MWQTWRWLGFGSMLALLLAVATDDVFAQKKDKKGASKVESFTAEPADYAKIQNSRELAGSLVAVDAASKTLIFRVDFPRYEQNPKYKPPKTDKKGTATPNYAKEYDQINRTYADLQKQQKQAMLAKNPQERQKALFRIQQDQMKLQQQQAQLIAKINQANAKAAGKDVKALDPNNQPYITVSSFKDYELPIADEAPVRKLFLNLEYDDTGNVRKYTDKEKEELRGKDKTKPGYLAKFEDLQPTQEVKLSLTPAKAKKKDPDADEGVVNLARPTVTMIVMTKELPGGGIQAAPEKKKGKK